MRKKESVPARTLQERIEMLERQHKWLSWYILAVCFLVGIGFFLINRKIVEVFGITSGIISNMEGVLGLLSRILRNVT